MEHLSSAMDQPQQVNGEETKYKSFAAFRLIGVSIREIENLDDMMNIANWLAMLSKIQ
jgi:hypothetical protein